MGAFDIFTGNTSSDTASEATKTAEAAKDFCFSCSSLETYGDLASDFAHNLALALEGPMAILFMSMASCWVVVVGLKIGLFGENPTKFLPNLMYVIIAGLLLTAQPTSTPNTKESAGTAMIEKVYNVSLKMMTDVASVAFEVAGGKIVKSEVYKKPLPKLANSAENAIFGVLVIAANIAKSGTMVDMINYVYALVLVLPYFLLGLAYGSQVVVSIFRLMMLATLAPFLFLSFAFGWGRGMAHSGIKTLIATILVMFASTAALAMTIGGVNAIDITKSAEDLNNFASVTNPKFLTILFLGWAGTAFQAEGTSLANSIAGSSLTNVAAGIMTAGMGSAIIGMKAASMAGIKLPGKAVGAAAALGGAISNAPENIAKTGGNFRELGNFVTGKSNLMRRIKDANRIYKNKDGMSRFVD